MKNTSLSLLSLLSCMSILLGQQPQQRPGPPTGGPGAAGQGSQTPQGGQTPEIRGALDRLRPNYVLRAGDQILVRAFEMEEISERPYRVDGDGFINLPVLGRVKAGGVTVERLEAELVESLRKYVRQPQVTITVVQFSSEPVFFVGAFKAPGIYPLEGKRTLVEMMSAIGGLLPTASRRIKVTRRKEFGDIPLANAIPSPDGTVSSIEVNMASLQENVNPAEDILLQPYDVISVERAEMIYVTGQVARVGAFELQERDSMSVIQVLTLAGGVGIDADIKGARILRPVLNSSRRAEVPLDLKKILAGQANDMPLMANDVLYIPKSGFSKAVAGRTALFLIPMAMSVMTLILYTTN